MLRNKIYYYVKLLIRHLKQKNSSSLFIDDDPHYKYLYKSIITIYILCLIDFIDIKIMKLILFMNNTTIKCKEKVLKKKCYCQLI